MALIALPGLAIALWIGTKRRRRADGLDADPRRNLKRSAKRTPATADGQGRSGSGRRKRLATPAVRSSAAGLFNHDDGGAPGGSPTTPCAFIGPV
jgi:hypothetical protein